VSRCPPLRRRWASACRPCTACWPNAPKTPDLRADHQTRCATTPIVIG
jgi:hypothetical protein